MFQALGQIKPQRTNLEISNMFNKQFKEMILKGAHRTKEENG